MTTPHWEPIDDRTADLLTLVAKPNPATEAREWAEFLIALYQMAEVGTWRIDPNRLRERLRGFVHPQRIGAYVCKAKKPSSGPILRESGDYATSTDRESGNAGKRIRINVLTTTGMQQAVSAYRAAQETSQPSADDEPLTRPGDEPAPADLDQMADYRASKEAW